MANEVKQGMEGEEDVVAEIAERYEEKNFFKRLKNAFAGLKEPKFSREYKEAVMEIQRLRAPLIAIVSVVLFVIVLIVVTAMEGVKESGIQITRIEAEEQTPPPEDMEEEVAEKEVYDDQEEAQNDILANFDLAPATESMQADSMNIVQAVNSPVKFRQSVGTPTTKIGLSLGGMRNYGKGTGKGLGSGGRQVTGDMVGKMFDFKRSADGSSRQFNYKNDMKLMAAKNFKPDELPFYAVDRRITASHIFCPSQPASIGPETFGVADQMQPRGWAAHYTTMIMAPTRKAEYRFVGGFDDWMVIWVDGKLVFDATWPGKAGALYGTLTDTTGNAGKYTFIHDLKLVTGEWFELSDTTPVRLDLIVGEQPGGKIGGQLCIEEKGYPYDKGPDGRLILPIFATAPLSTAERERIQANNKREKRNQIKIDMVPVFGADAIKATRELMGGARASNWTKDDVAVDIDI